MSLHADARAVLTAWQTADPGQDRLRKQFLDQLAARPDAMWRTCLSGHLTATTLVVDTTLTRVLLTLHQKARKWLPMGGHCEPADPTLADAALREAAEESGIPGLRLIGGPVQLDRHPGPCAPQTDHLDVEYLAIAPSNAVEVISSESLDLRWFPVDALPEPTDGATRRLVAMAVALRDGPPR